MKYDEKIRFFRKKFNMSQNDLARQLGISNRAVSKWENGVSMPNIENYYKMSKIFKVPLEYFVSDDENVRAEKKPRATGMKSLRELYKIGFGPSSSHTIGPERACRYVLDRYPEADGFEVTLFGSLAKTGAGHGTDRVIKKTLTGKRVTVNFNYTDMEIPHANTMDITAFRGNAQLGRVRVTSTGGGDIEVENDPLQRSKNVYPHTSFAEITRYCGENRITLFQYVRQFEDDGILDYLAAVWRTMKESVESGLEADGGVLPGGLNVQRKAKYLYSQHHIDETAETRENRMVCAYAYAVSEENACGNTIVTAPTCGASGVVPAVLYYNQIKRGLKDEDIIRALAVGGIIGNIIKTNASISGAECGCQAEIGSACAMAAAMLGELFSLRTDQIEYAAEIAIEHHLGLTCDPVCGLVQIPCIERNAVAAMRAINAVSLANFLTDTRKISFDQVVRTMAETGRDLLSQYRETAEGGLAKTWLD